MKRLRPLPDMPRPLLFAHRGVSSIAPENTMAAFRLARELGIPGIELDIHLCSSGELVVIHDYDAMRTTGVCLYVERSPYAQIRELDSGSFKDARYAGERIPLLTEVFEEFGESMYFDIELKSESIKANGLESAFSKVLRDFRLPKGVVVSSFNPFAIRRFKELSPGVPTAIIYSRAREAPWFLRHGEGRFPGRADYLKPEHSIARPNRYGRKVVPWTVDDPERARELLAAGCEGLISNRPQDLKLT